MFAIHLMACSFRPFTKSRRSAPASGVNRMIERTGAVIFYFLAGDFYLTAHGPPPFAAGSRPSPLVDASRPVHGRRRFLLSRGAFTLAAGAKCLSTAAPDRR